MKIVVSEIPDEGLLMDSVETLELEEGEPVEVRLDLSVTRSGKDVFVRGSVDAELALTCSRCLREFVRRTSVPVDLAYSPAEELKGKESHELAADELETGFYTEDEIDIGEMAKEQILLNMPIKTLCDESCKGICPVCGADLNVQTCGCEVKRVDPRMQALGKLLKKGKE